MERRRFGLPHPVKEIAGDFYMIRIPLAFRLKHVNVYAALQDGRITLFDTGPNLPGILPVLENSLHHLGRSIPDIERILVTHFHADHCGLAGIIKERSGGTIHMSEIEFATIRSYGRDDLHRDRIRTFYEQQGLDNQMIELIISYLRAFRSVTYPFQVDEFLREGEGLTIGQRTIRVLLTPGHTRGHICYFLPDEQILLGGDCVLPRITPNLSPDLLSPSFYPLRSFMDSLEKIGDLPVKRVYPSHGPPFRNLKGRVKAIQEHHHQRKELICRALKKGPASTSEISEEVFGRNLPEFDRILALNETYVHLIELEKESRIIRYKERERYFFRLI
jgi:glyoxylase-like metal-dependent hydrolase (beta-lactamase superfamily II)